MMLLTMASQQHKQDLRCLAFWKHKQELQVAGKVPRMTARLIQILQPRQTLLHASMPAENLAMELMAAA